MEEPEEVEMISEWPVTTSQDPPAAQKRCTAFHQVRTPSTVPKLPASISVVTEAQTHAMGYNPIDRNNSQFSYRTNRWNVKTCEDLESKETVLFETGNKRRFESAVSLDKPTKIRNVADPKALTSWSEHPEREKNVNGSSVDTGTVSSTDQQGCTQLQSSDSGHIKFCCPEERPQELLVQTRVARWWRREGRQRVRLKTNGKALPESSNPNTLLYHLARLPEGRNFLEEELRHLKHKVEQTSDVTGDVFAALGSVEEWLGKIEDAATHLDKAISADQDNKEWKWLRHRISRQLAVRNRQKQQMDKIPSNPAFPAVQQVERVSSNSLTFLEFFHKYALARVPIIITDLASTMTEVPWDLQHIRDVAGDCVAQVKRSVEGSVEWAELEESKTVKVCEFLENLDSRKDYLFDWSLPLHCPRLAEELTIPKYFAGDFLQRTTPGSLYRDSWPSLFVAPPGLHSGLHVDAFASNFWMALFQGRKRWVFFRQEDAPCLYPVYAHSLDPVFEARVTDPDLKKHPLLSLVRPVECILNAGEVLFVPGGSPHYVENLDTTVAISANFVDLSNWRKVLEELDVNGLVDPRSADLASQFRQSTFISRMRSDMDDVPWRMFKAWPPSDADGLDVTEESVASA